MSVERSMGRHELLAELIDAADAMRDDAIGEIGLSLVRGCVSDWTREFEGGAAATGEGPEELPLPPPAGRPGPGDGREPERPAGQPASWSSPAPSPLGPGPCAPPGLGFISFGQRPSAAPAQAPSSPPAFYGTGGASSNTPWRDRSASFVEQVTHPRDWHAGATPS